MDDRAKVTLPQAEVDGFKHNLTLIEKKLPTDVGIEFRKNIDCAISWLRYAQDPSCEEYKAEYIRMTFASNVSKNLVGRKFDVADDEIIPIQQCLIAALELLTSRMGFDESINAALEALLNPLQPLYMKLNIFKGARQQGPVSAYQQLIAGLSEGSCVDCFVGSQWQVGIIERFSEFRTEFEVSLASDGSKLWLSIERDNGRIAAFGTQTGLSEPSSTALHVSHQSVLGLFNDPRVITSVPDVGTLLDAQDKTGVWYQACVLGCLQKTEEIAIPSEIKIEEVLDFTNAELENIKPADEPPKAEAVTKEVTLVHVSFIGQLSGCDELIDLASHRLAKWNTVSLGRKGDLKVRDEIYTVSSIFREEEEPSGGKYAKNYANAFVSKMYVLMVNHFGEHGGFALSLQILKRLAQQRPVDYLLKALPLVNIVGHVHRVVAKSQLVQLINDTLRLVNELLAAMGPVEIRQTAIEAIEVTLSHIEAFSFDTYGKKPSVADFIDGLRLRIGTMYLMSQFLNRRLGGLKLILDMLKRAENAAANPSGLSIKPSVVPGHDAPSVYVVPVNYSFTTKRICEELTKLGILDVLYNDSSIHESIVTRSAGILKAYAEEGILKDQDIQKLVQSSLTRGSPVKKVLEEVAGHFGVASMKIFLLAIQQQEASTLSEGLISILASIGSSSRRKLMSSGVSSSESQDDGSEARSGFLEIHSLVADILWTTASETSSACNDIKVLCMAKLENLVDLGVALNAALEDNCFPWAMQWYRVQDLIRKAVHSLVSQSSVIPGVKVLQAFLYSWPIKKPSVLGDVASAVPFQPMRFGVADFIISKYDAYSVATDCIVRLREQAQLSNGSVLSYQMDYSHQLELLLDFVYNLFRSSEKTLLPINELFRLWDLMVTNATNVDEFDSVVLLFGKIATRIGDNLDIELNRSEEKLQSTREQLLEIYTQLICDKAGSGFFKSDYFSLRTLTRTVEKWFRWINGELGLLVESKDAAKVVAIKVDLSTLQGIDIFLSIVLSCDDDDVASCCVNFIISLIQIAKSYALTYRETLLSQCLQHLTALNGSVSLQRILLLLNGLIEESFASSKKKMYAHSMTTTNRKITFKVSCTSKNFAGAGGELVMKYNDTVEEMMQRISKMVQTPIEGFKVFKMGKEIVLADFRKPLGVLCTVGDRETLVVVERPLHSRTGQLQPVDEEQEAPNVAISLVCSEENTKALFDLLKKASSSEVHSIWSTISQLPTFYHVLDRWLRLSETSIPDITFPFNRQNISRLGELVYSLQVVEMLLEGTVSVDAVLSQYDKTANHGANQTIIEWTSQFLSKGGFSFLCDSYKWITSVLSAFQQDYVYPGVDSDLCVLGLFILNKLIRSLLSVHCNNSPKFSAIASMLPNEIDLLLKNTQGASSDPTVIDLTDSSEAKEQSVPDVAKVDDRENAREDLRNTNFVVGYSDWDGLYWHVLLSSLLIEGAFLKKIKRPDGDSGSASFSATTAHMNQTEDSLKNILYIYTCVAILSPSVLNSRGLQDAPGMTASYECVLDTGLSLGEDGKNDSFVKLLKSWFVNSLMMFLRVIETFYKEVDGAQELSDLSSLKSHIIGWLLNQRPPIAVGQSRDTSGNVGLFSLTTKLLENGGNSIVSSDRRREICKSIVQEVQSVVEACKANFMRLAIANLEGNMRVLASLAKTDDKYVLSYFDKNIVEFFLQDVLGVMEVSKCTQPCIIESSDIRANTYQVLGHICERSSVLSLRIYNNLRSIHNSIPLLVAFDMNFENESRSATGFSGLRNLGNTCYMNSLLQMLFMIPSIRNHLLLANILDPSLYTADELEFSTIYQLQVVFKHLRYSAKKFYNPACFMRVFGLEHHIQQDACEYFLLLCEKYEQGILELQQKKQKTSSSSPDATITDIFKSSFGGKLCNQMFVAPAGVSDVNDPAIAAQLESSMSEHGLREQDEAFNLISLDVKSCGNIRNSLQQFIKYEVIADYEWKENQPRVNIVKRQCISTLSDTVIFHLKRFELNFDTFIREKVNDIFEFPVVLDLYPYTKMGLKGEVAQHPDEFVYELCGVVVHMGTSDSGHYYAYLRDTGSFVSQGPDRQNLWHEYNDSEIREFDPINIAVECYGGTTTSHDYVMSTKSFVKSESMNVKNAYMLVYTRKSCIGLQSSAKVDLSQQQADSVLQEILQDNASHTLCLRTLNRSHVVFYEGIVRTLITQTTKANKILSTSVISESIQFLSRYVSHTPYASLYKELFDLLFSYISKHDDDLMKQHILDLYKQEREREAAVIDSNGESTVSNNDDNLPSPPVKSVESTSADASAVIMPPLPPTTELLPASPALIRTLSASGDAMPGGESRTIASALSIQLLVYINNGFVEFVLSYLSSCNNDAMRLACNHGILSIFQQAWRVELSKHHDTSDSDGDKAAPESNRILTKILTYSNPAHFKFGGLSGSANANDNSQAVSFEDGNMDADLALALKLSQQTASSLTEKEPEGSKEEISSDVLANPFIQYIQLETFRFVFELTTDLYLNNICEYWRRGNTYIQMLLSIAKLDKCFRVLFVFRDLIAQCVDFVLGEQSPLNNKLYGSNSGKKRAPSSYLNSNNNSNNSKVILKNVPDWTHLLELLVLLVRECHIERDRLDTSVPLQERVYMSEWDFMAVTSKTLFSTLIKQTRYAQAFTDLAVYLSRDNIKFTSMVCEVLFEELSVTAAENVHYIFDIINALLLIPDSLSSQRLSILFGRSNICILDIMKNYATQGIKSYVVLVVIRSFLNLFVEHNSAFNSLLCTPQSSVYAWSCWMAQFLFKHMSMATSSGKEESKGDAATNTNTNTNANAATKPAGPPVIVYGEDDEERLLTWQARYEKTYNLLSSILLSWDIDAASLALDSLPNSSAPVTVPVAIAQPYMPSSPGPVVQATAVVSKGVGEPAQAMELSDCMTDEEFARYLASMSQ